MPDAPGRDRSRRRAPNHDRRVALRLLGHRPIHLLSGRFVESLIAVCARRTTKFARDDCIFAAANLMLAATDRGLGTCWIAAFDPAAARDVLGLPDDVEPIAFTPLGYAVDAPRQKKRRPLDELAAVRYHAVREQDDLVEAELELVTLDLLNAPTTAAARLKALAVPPFTLIFAVLFFQFARKRLAGVGRT